MKWFRFSAPGRRNLYGHGTVEEAGRYKAALNSMENVVEYRGVWISDREAKTLKLDADPDAFDLGHVLKRYNELQTVEEEI
jgi:hypothetical protein